MLIGMLPSHRASHMGPEGQAQGVGRIHCTLYIWDRFICLSRIAKESEINMNPSVLSDLVQDWFM